MKKANYQKTIQNTGEIFEMTGTYEYPEDHYINAPDMLSESERETILQIMVKNSIKHLEVIN
jgi:hypothetical protein